MAQQEPSRAKTLPPGTRIDRYEITELIGKGGFGSVYRARHAILGQPVALKLLHPGHRESPESVDRFLREARAVATVGSPHIVKVLDCGTSAEGEPFIVLELLEGEPLQALLEREAPLPVERAVSLSLQILDGLDAAHGAGIVHRDLKPANVFVSPDPDTPGGDFVRVVDFGISKMRAPEDVRSATRTGVVMGTPSFMAPEQFRGARDVDARADLYSLAVVLYQMLAGRAPHEGSSYEDLVVKVCTERPPPLQMLARHVPPALAGVVDRGLSRDPDGRWPSAAAFSHALRIALGDGAPLPSPAPVRTVPQPHARPPAPATRDGTRGAAIAPGAASMTPRPAILSPEQAAPTVVRTSRNAWLVAGAIVASGAIALGTVVMIASSDSATTASVTGAVSGPGVAPSPRPLSPFGGEGAAPAGTGGAAVSAPVPSPGAVPVPVPAPAAVPATPDPSPQPSPPSGERGPEVREAAAESPSPLQGERDGVRGVTIGEPRIVGEIPFSPVFRIVRASAHSLDACRTASAATVHVHLHLALGEIRLAVPAPDNPGPRAAATCVANRIAAAFPSGFEPETSGIIMVPVTLAAR